VVVVLRHDPHLVQKVASDTPATQGGEQMLGNRISCALLSWPNP